MGAFLELERRHYEARVDRLRDAFAAGIDHVHVWAAGAFVGAMWLVFGRSGDTVYQFAAVTGVGSLAYVAVDLLEHLLKARRMDKAHATAERFDAAARSIAGAL